MCSAILEGGKAVIFSSEYNIWQNELFKFVMEKSGEEGIQKVLSGLIRKGTIEEPVQKGLKGMYDFWSKMLGEEGGRYTLTLRDDEFILDMHSCHAIEKMTKAGFIPYKGYCFHCDTRYRPGIEKYGYKFVLHFIDENKGECRLRVMKE